MSVRRSALLPLRWAKELLIFLDNNVDIVLSGGQTMNPTTEDFVNAIEALPAEHIYLLPNNGNIILAAQQAAELSGRNVTVIPTRPIPQGLAPYLPFRKRSRRK